MEGDTSASRELLRKALRDNRFVAKHLVADEPLPSSPSVYEFRGAEEAMICVAECGQAWGGTEGPSSGSLTARAQVHTRSRRRARGIGDRFVGAWRPITQIRSAFSRG